MSKLKNQTEEKIKIIKLESNIGKNQEPLVEIEKPYLSKIEIEERGNKQRVLIRNEYIDLEKEGLLSSVRSTIDFIVKNPFEFVKLVNKDPSLVLNDYSIKSAIREFQSNILTQPRDLANKAKETLKDARLSVFIPEDAPRKLPQNVQYFIAVSIPGYIYLETKGISSYLNDNLKKRYRSDHKKEEDIATAFKEYFRAEMPEDLINSKNIVDATSIALAFLTYKYEVPYNQIRKKYFEDQKEYKLIEENAPIGTIK